MKSRRLKFVWGASRVIRGRWRLGLFCLYDRDPTRYHDGLAISVRGVLAWGAVLLAVGYVGAATALFWVWQRNPYSTLIWSDALLLPLRRDEIAEKKGRAFIAQGLDLCRAAKWVDGARYLQLGLARYPRDFRARATLAQFYVRTNQRVAALRVLQAGATGDYPGRAYLESLFGAAEQGEDYEVVLATAERFAGADSAKVSAGDRRWLRERHFAAAMAAGRPAEALAIAERENVGDIASEHRVVALLALGRAEEAAAHVREWRARPHADPRVTTRLLVRVLRELRRFDEMDAALAELRGLNPADPIPLVYAVVQQAIAGRDAAANAAFDELVFRFGGHADNLLLLAAPLAEIEARELLQRCAEVAAERGFALLRWQAALVQVHARRGEWEPAAKLLAGLPPEAPRPTPVGQAWREWMEALLAAARLPSEPAQQELLARLRSRPWAAGTYRQTIDILQRAERLDTVRAVVGLGRAAFPGSTWLAAKAAELDALVAARAAPAAAAPARPSGEAEVAVEDFLAQARHAQAKGDVPATLAAARLHLNGERARSDQVLALATDFMEAGDRATAAALAKEVLRRVPEYPPARRFLAKAETPAAAKP